MQHSGLAVVRVQDRLAFWLVAGLIRVLRLFPRRFARWLGALMGKVAYIGLARLRRVGLQNLKLAYPEQQNSVLRGTLKEVYRHLGLLLAEFCLMGRYTAAEAQTFIEYDGLEHYLAAKARGNGVLVLTGHLGAWELSSFFHSLMGYPMGLVIRKLDNPLINDLVNRIRCLHGNRVIHKDNFARGLITAMRAGETVGILMDTNMTPPQGVFVPFFGIDACSASGMARVAAKTGAAVLPGFLLWDKGKGKYVLQFGQSLELTRTDDAEADAVVNTALFTRTIEHFVRSAPEQWLWMHRRWKTRPAGEAGLY